MGLFINSIVSPLIPAIIHTDDPENIRQYDFFNTVRPSSLMKSLSEEYPMVNDIFNAIQPGFIKNFSYYIGIFDGPTLEYFSDGALAHNVWEVGFKKILQFPYVTDNAGIFYVPRSTWKGGLYFTSTEWIRHLVGADKANSKGYSGQGMNAVVIDTGGTRINSQTMMMQKQTAIPGNDTDQIGHGEHTASTMFGRKSIDYTFSEQQGKIVEVQGMAPQSNGIEIKALDYGMGSGTDSQLLRALDMAITAKADVVNASWGSSETYSEPSQDPYFIPIQTMVQKHNIIFVAASGDSGPKVSPSSPAAMPDAISVGSINAVSNSNPAFGNAGEVSGFSGRGPTPWGSIYPDIVTYGAIFDSAITGWMRTSYTGIDHQHQAIAGTSMSSPVAAGLITLMRQAYYKNMGTKMSAYEIKTMMSTTGMNYWNLSNKDNNRGWGAINWDIFEQYMNDKYGIII